MGLANWWLSRSAESSAASDKAKLSSMASSPSASSSSKSSVFKWPLKRAKSEPRKTQTQHHAHLRLRAVANAVAAFKPSPASPRTQPPPANPLFPEPSTESSESMLSCRLMNLRGLSAGVSQAKDLLQQCASVVSLYPSLVQLTVPCASTSEEPLTKPVASVVVVDEQQPVSEPEPATTPVFWVASEPLLRFENRIQSLVAKQALETRLTSDGCGGVYFLQDASAPDATAFAVFKPRDEEYMAPMNPRGYVKENAIVGETEHPVNKGFRVGNGALRERAAFLLDEAYGNFSGVPVTSLLSLPLANGEVKEGSVQAFVESESSAEDMGPLKFSVPEVHKVGILDVRLFNTDRHAGNILLHKQSPGSATFEMTPIDHGFCLPSYKHLDNANFDWLNWPQAQFPFTCEEIDHIASLDASRDASILRSLSIEEECITTMRICTSLLKAGAEEGFSLFEIGSHVQREGDFSQPSTLEKLVAEAVEKVAVDESDASFADALVEEVERAVVAMFADQQPKKKVRSISCFS